MHNSETPESNPVDWTKRLIVITYVMIFSILIVGFLLVYPKLVTFFNTNILASNWNLNYLFLSIIVVGLLAVQYGVAYWVYRKEYYLIWLLFWLSNLGYILHGQLIAAEYASSNSITEQYYLSRSVSMLLAAFSDFPIFLAARIVRKNSLSRWDFLIPLIVGFIFIAVLEYTTPSMRLTVSVIFAVISGTLILLYFFYELWRNQVNADTSKTFTWFAITFLLLAIWQLSYLVVLSNEWRTEYLIYFKFVALAIKSANLVILSIMIFQDVQKQLTEEQLANLRKPEIPEDIGNASAQLDSLAKVVQHEVKTPIGLLVDELNELRIAKKDESELKEKLDSLNQHAQQIRASTELINLLEASAAAVTSELQQLNVLSEVNKSIKEFKQRLKPSKININAEEKKNVFFKVNRELMGFVFNNILKNSWEAVKNIEKNGKIDVVIDVKGDDPSQIQITFSDNGIGPPPEVPFEKLKELGVSFNKNNNSIERANHGVGLFVIDHVIKLHGGNFALESKEGGGALLTIWLPRAETKKQRSKEEI